MKNLKLRKLVAVALVAMTIATVSPVGASAAWKQNSKGWWNTEGNSWSTGWRTIDNTWYYFGSDGYMKTGWANDRGTWYYLQPSGAMKTGWVNDGGTWYYLQSSGAMKTGWANDGGTWYYLQPSGAMKTGWVNDGGTWYFTAASGAMQTGVVEVQGKVYYLAPSGAMATGTVAINGATYNFAPSGEAVGDKIPTPTVAFSANGVQQTPSTTGTTTGTTTDTTTGTTTSSGGGGGSSSGGSSSGGSSSGGNTSGGNTPVVTTTDITGLVSTKLANTLQNHPTLADNISVTAGNPIVVELNDSELYSLQNVFNTAKNQDLSLIEARLTKAEKIMNSNAAMLKVDEFSFKEYLAKAIQNYKNSDGNSDYFNTDGSFNTIEIAKRINDKTLTYDKFKDALKVRIIAMCDETKQAPTVSISSVPVTKIVRGGNTIYDTSLSIDTNINDLISLGDTTTGTYTVYCGPNYFTVVVK